MSRKPETALIQAVHKKLKTFARPPHFEKMHNPYRGGTADVWYSGDVGDLWVEYKWIPALPASWIVVPDLTALQLDWLGSRTLEGRDVWVAVGSPEGIAFSALIAQWVSGLYANPDWLFSKDEFAKEIYSKVGSCKYYKPSSAHHSLSTGSTVRSLQQSLLESQFTQSTTVSGSTKNGGNSAELGNQELSGTDPQNLRGRHPRSPRRA